MLSAFEKRSEPHGPRTGRAPVLVVEDDDGALRLFSLYLTGAGYGVIAARSGEEALQEAGRARPLAIILDILLPDTDGWKVLAALKASPATRTVPVVIASVLDRQELAFKLGAREFLVKPVTRDALLRALRRSLRGARHAGTPPNILVAHSDADALLALTDALAAEGYDVAAALGGAEAIAVAGRLRPDLVVLDLSLGPRTCAEVIAALRRHPATRDTPALVIANRPPPPAWGPSLGDGARLVVVGRGNPRRRLVSTVNEQFDAG